MYDINNEITKSYKIGTHDFKIQCIKSYANEYICEICEICELIVSINKYNNFVVDFIGSDGLLYLIPIHKDEELLSCDEFIMKRALL